MWQALKLWWWRRTRVWCVVYDCASDGTRTQDMISTPMAWRNARGYAQIFGGTPMPSGYFEYGPQGLRLKTASRCLVTTFAHFGGPAKPVTT